MELHARISHLARPAASSVALGAMLALLAGTADADAAKRKRHPVVTSVAPMDAKVGETITLRGRYFIRGKNKNSVVFKRDGARAVFVKTTLGTARQIRVVVPESLRKYLTEGVATRVRLRVLSERFGKSFTSASKSPRITAAPVPAASKPGAPGTTNSTSSTGTPAPAGPAPAPVCTATADEDGDWLMADKEKEWGLDACKADSDSDGVPDGYEFQAARDLNDGENEVNYLPYPGDRPYPNPLDKDADTDYDGDGIPLGWEYALHKDYGSAPTGPLPRDDFELAYSDGEQYSLGTRDPATGRRVLGAAADAATYRKAQDFLDWAGDNGYDPVVIDRAYPWHDTAGEVPYDIRDASLDGTVQASEESLADLDGDTFISDDERDEDADGLSNIDELRGAMSPGYWEKCYGVIGEGPFPVKYQGTDLTNPDTDGDGVLDGADDQDHDDIPNVMELSRFAASGGFMDWLPLKGTCTVDHNLKNGPDIDGDGEPNWVVLHADGDYGRVNPFNPCLPYRWSRTCPSGVQFGTSFAPFDGSPWYSLQ